MFPAWRIAHNGTGGGRSVQSHRLATARGSLRMLSLLAAIFGGLQIPESVRAQLVQPPRELPVRRDLLLAATSEDFSTVSSLSASAAGSIAVGQREDSEIRVYSSTGNERYRFGRRGSGPGEFQVLGGYVGWVGDTLWVTDPPLRRLTWIDPTGKLLRTAPFPASNAASAPSPPTAPRQGETYLVGVDARGDFLLSTSLIGVSVPDPWRAAAHHAQSSLWWQARSAESARFLGFQPQRVGGCAEGKFGYYQIACPLSLIAFAPAADRFVIARPKAITAKDGSFWLTVVGTRGDSLVHRLLRYSATPIPRSFVDSSRAACRARESAPPRIAACDDLSHSPQLRYIHRVLLGHDNTVWLQLHPDKNGTHWLILSGSGEPIGRTTFPSNFFLWAANRTTVWGTETDADDLESVVRYRIGR